MRILVLLTACAGLVLSAAQAAQTPDPQPQKRPNIIVILADDLGWRDVGFNGSEIKTPHLDALAETGKQLTHFYAHPTCSPTRASLLTGQSGLRLGVIRPYSKLNPKGLPLDRKLLPEFLKQHGYQTALAGKWHLGPLKKAHLPNSRGFDSFYGHLTGGVGYWDHVHGGHYDWQRDGVTARDEGYTTHLLTDEALRVVRTRDKEKPLFLYLAFGAPHLPNEAPSDAVHKYSHIETKNRRIHAAMVSEMDTAIGKLMKELEAQGIREETLVFFMSDNGGLTQYRLLPNMAYKVVGGLKRIFGVPIPVRFVEFLRTNMFDGAADNGPLRGGKGSILEGGIRVPAIIHWPSKLASANYEGRMQVTDVLSTLMEAATGTPETGQLSDGKSMWPALTKDAKIAPSDFVTVGLDGSAFISGQWKLIERRNGDLELYDINQDATESHNLAAEKPALAEKLRQQFAASAAGPDTHIPVAKAILNSDGFGGEETQPPLAEMAVQ
jgi:arylsulfatase A-like enzyme